MKRLLLTCALLLVALPAEAKTIRMGLFVGNNIGFGDDEPLRHAEREASAALLRACFGAWSPQRTPHFRSENNAHSYTLKQVHVSLEKEKSQSNQRRPQGHTVPRSSGKSQSLVSRVF